MDYVERKNRTVLTNIEGKHRLIQKLVYQFLLRRTKRTLCIFPEHLLHTAIM